MCTSSVQPFVESLIEQSDLNWLHFAPAAYVIHGVDILAFLTELLLSYKIRVSVTFISKFIFFTVNAMPNQTNTLYLVISCLVFLKFSYLSA